MFIPQRTIDEVRDRADIAEVVARYVELRRSGSNFKALCPFHQEKTPSFMVSPEKQIFHCFGCGRGGNIFSFLMEIEGVSFPEAVRSLGKTVGVDVVAREIPEEVKTRNESFYRANEFAARYYQRALLDRKVGEKARRYLDLRGVPRSAWEEFKLGWAEEGWDKFFSAARKAGIALDALRELRLVVPRESGQGYYDYFRKRLVFPIVSISNRVLAFGARTLEEGVEPKYVNSVESPIFAKRKALFGLNRAREPIRKERGVLLVEGYTDCISLHALGFKHTVAICGTATTWDHALILRRLTQSVTLIPDGDSAGERAALSAGSLLVAAGLSVRVARLEPGEDPDTAARRLGGGGLLAIIENAMDYFEYLNYIMKYRVSSLREKEETLRRITESFAHLEDRIRLEMVLKEVSTVFSVPLEDLRARMGGARDRVRGPGKKEVGTGGQNRERLEKTLLRLLLQADPLVDEARDKLDTDDFLEKSCREFYKLLDCAWENHIDLRSSAFQRMAEEAGLQGLAAEVALISLPPGDFAKLLKDTVRRVKELKIRDELKVLRERLQDLPEDSEEAVAVAEYYARLKKALSEL